MLSVWGTTGLTPALMHSRATESFGPHPGTLPQPQEQKCCGGGSGRGRGEGRELQPCRDISELGVNH